jgi:hypothetical protein
MPIAPTATDVLDREFLELRAGILQAAAQLDRLDRATGTVATDPRMAAVSRAIQILMELAPGRAEKIQLVFSRPFESDWKQKLQIKTA